MKRLRGLSLAIAATSGLWSIPASAQDDGSQHPRLAFCSSSDPSRTMITEPFMTNRTDQQELREEWMRFTAANYGQSNPYHLTCSIYPWELREAAQNNRAGFPALMGGWQRPAPVTVTWRPQGETVPGEAAMLAQLGIAQTPSQSPSGTLAIEDNGIAARTKAWEDTVLEGQRQQAADRAKRVAETARVSAEYQATLAKVFEEMRRRGNKQ